MRKVLILGGYGNFGKRIARALVAKNIPVIIAGRSGDKAQAFASTLPSSFAQIAVFDVKRELSAQLQILKPAVVINTCGPFQASNYATARMCIAQSVHYIDLADARGFVTGIMQLDKEAHAHNVAVISGASTVPGLSSAVLEQYASEFSVIDLLKFGISPGQKAERGLATTQAIMTYVGKRLKPFAGVQDAYGWQDIYRQEYPLIGKRWMANCDIPDLDLLPARYNIKTIRFSAGMELSSLHLGIWLLSWLVRFGVPLNLPAYAAQLLNASNRFNIRGSANGGMHIILKGKDKNGTTCTRSWFIIAKKGDGPQIPCVPAVVLAARMVSGIPVTTGAYPCVGLVSLAEYMDELKPFSITNMTTMSFE